MSTASKRLRELRRYAYDWPDDLPRMVFRAEQRAERLVAILSELNENGHDQDDGEIRMPKLTWQRLFSSAWKDS